MRFLYVMLSYIRIVAYLQHARINTMRKFNKKLIIVFPIAVLLIILIILLGNKTLLRKLLPAQQTNEITYPKIEVYDPSDTNALFYITKITPEEVTLDYVLKIPDVLDNKLTLAGTKACLEDGKCSSNWCEISAGKSCLPNGFFLRNNSSTTVTYKIAQNAEIRIINSRQIETLIGISVTDAVDQFTRDTLFKNRVYKIRLVDSVIYNMTEMYNP